MIQLPARRFAIAALENGVKQIGVTDLVKRLIGRSDTGGVRWNQRDMVANLKHILAVSDIVQRHVDVRGKTGIEIGPGDNLATCYHLLTIGAAQMFGVEKFASIDADWNRQLFERLGGDCAAQLRHINSRFEQFEPGVPVHFIYSHDVIEHVDPAPAFQHAFHLLQPGGDFINAVDFTGHGVFHNPARPLDFLTCPDGLWKVLFSAMETTNRIRWSELLELSTRTGFEIVRAHAVRRVAPGYLESIRPHLLPRYRQLSDDDLSVTHCELHLRKPR